MVAYLTLAVPSTPAQGSGYSLSGKVHYFFYDVLDSPSVYIYKWNGSSWAFHGIAFADSCGDYTYDTGGPGQFMGSVSGLYYAKDATYHCGWSDYLVNVSGSQTTEVSAANPSAYMNIFTLG